MHACYGQQHCRDVPCNGATHPVPALSTSVMPCRPAAAHHIWRDCRGAGRAGGHRRGALRRRGPPAAGTRVAAQAVTTVCVCVQTLGGGAAATAAFGVASRAAAPPPLLHPPWLLPRCLRPQNIRIRHTIVLDDPTPDPRGLEEHIPEASPPPQVRVCVCVGGGGGHRVEPEGGGQVTGRGCSWCGMPGAPAPRAFPASARQGAARRPRWLTCRAPAPLSVPPELQFATDGRLEDDWVPNEETRDPEDIERANRCEPAPLEWRRLQRHRLPLDEPTRRWRCCLPNCPSQPFASNVHAQTSAGRRRRTTVRWCWK